MSTVWYVVLSSLVGILALLYPVMNVAAWMVARRGKTFPMPWNWRILVGVSKYMEWLFSNIETLIIKDLRNSVDKLRNSAS